jgi:hypothetical protein
MVGDLRGHRGPRWTRGTRSSLLALAVSTSLFALVTAPSATPAQSPTGLAAAYAFNEGSGTSAADASGGGLTGTLTNGATWGTGHAAGAVSLDGVNDFVELGNPLSLQLTGSMTVSAWVKSAAFPADDAAIVSKRTSGEIGFQLDTTIDRGPRTVGFKLTTSAGGNMFRYGATSLLANSWYFVTGVYNAATSELHVYLNGQLDDGTLVGTVSATQQNSTANVNIGRRPGLNTFNFNGLIDDVRIYSRALTAGEIQTDMNTPVAGGSGDSTPPTAPTGLSATATSSTQINLSWSAATDNVAVTGYRVERCQGSGCSSWAEIAQPTGTTYSDLGRSASTSYSYRVRAVDAAGNLGPYSATASAKTKRTGGPIGFQLDTTIDRALQTVGLKLTITAGGSMFRYGAAARHETCACSARARVLVPATCQRPRRRLFTTKPCAQWITSGPVLRPYERARQRCSPARRLLRLFSAVKLARETRTAERLGRAHRRRSRVTLEHRLALH